MNGHREFTPSPTRPREGRLPSSLVRWARHALLMLAVLAAPGGRAIAQAQPQQDAARRAAQEAAAREAELARRRAIEAAQVQARVVAMAPQQIWSDEQFEQWVLQSALRQNPGNPGTARQRLDAQLALQVEQIDRACQLTDEQKKKVQLIGKGDIKRLVDGVEGLKEKFRSVNNDVNRLQEIMPDVTPLQTAMQGGLFHDNSLLRKSLHNTLTAEQFGRYEAAERERKATQHRAAIELVVSMVERSAPLRDAQRRDFITLLINETKPPRKPGQYDRYVILLQLARVPEGRVKPLFTDAQWQVVSQLVDQYRGVEQQLRQMGVIADDDVEPAKAAVPRAVPKK